ncbi:MAG: protein translocase subunit SecD [Sedimentisphaerales bacterium]|nr:protein translocase subunit SecD [Sedimentisphaerales bacterium]
MNKNLLWKLVLVIVLAVVAFIELYPPSKTLNPGLDLAGGTSFIYELDMQGLKSDEQRNLAQRTIDVLRKRIDPTNTKNLIWRPQGNNRIEIQVPLASAEAREKRTAFEAALNALQSQNVNLAIIMRSLGRPAVERTADFEKFAGASKEQLAMLTTLATAHDERKASQQQRDALAAQKDAIKAKLSAAQIQGDSVEQQAAQWLKLSAAERQKAIKEFLGKNEPNAPLVENYLAVYGTWASVVDELTAPETGKNAQYKKAQAALENINLNIDRITAVLEMPAKSGQRTADIAKFKEAFPGKADKIDGLVKAFDNYRTLRGRLDDPEDLRRMLKGSGVLEFRILPRQSDGTVSTDVITMYLENLKTKGPKSVPDDKYVWAQIEKIEEWKNPDSIIGQFGDKYYVLASNKLNEQMLRVGPLAKNWKLVGSYPTSDQMGRRAIGFSLDDAGGNLFRNLTRNNINRPLAILLDNVALSAPNINSVIGSSGVIEGTFTSVEIEDMVNKLNAGSLPARLIEPPLSIKSIGPSIGKENLKSGITAGIIGLALVMLFMIIYYGKSGAVADMALMMNLLFVLAVMALSRATFTLPGIAGIILTIGMAVDANVLIHERIREEQEKGASLRIAIKNGYERAFLTIFDSNLTTILSAVVLYLVASEELKGFAITLILGLAASMFTAVFVTRVVFEILLDKKILRDRLNMLKIIGVPKIDWMKARNVLIPFSVIMVALSIFAFFNRGSDKYDIEFTGGTSVQINLRPEVNLDRTKIETMLADRGLQARVYSVGGSNKQYEINTTETNKTTTTITFADAGSQTVETVMAAITTAQEQFSGELNRLNVQKDSQNPAAFIVSTSQVNKSLVKDVLTAAFKDKKVVVSEPTVDEIVNNAITAAFGDMLAKQQDLHPAVVSVDTITDSVIGASPELSNFLGGIRIAVKTETPVAASEIISRFKDLRFKPAGQNLSWYQDTLLATDNKPLDPNAMVSTFVYVSVLPDAGFRQISNEEQGIFVENEKTKVLSALSLGSSLPRVTQIDPSLGSQAKVRGLIAIILAFLAIIVYVWVRFGASRYGFAGVLALVHDVIIATGAVVVCTWITGTSFGNALLIGDFKINLDVIAALLTIIGFSINDTIVIFDRIRENRGRGGILTPEIINNSINQTMSRTILTTFTAFLVVLIMYVWGGSGLRGFNFALLVGMISGTYSTIAIAAPLVLLQKKVKWN